MQGLLASKRKLNFSSKNTKSAAAGVLETMVLKLCVSHSM